MRVRQHLRAVASVVLVVLPVALMGIAALVVVSERRIGSDFATFWQSGHDVVHGRSPYPSLASLPAHATRLFAPFVYPPVAAFLMAPFSILSFPVASVLFFALNLVAAGLALRLLDVTDWRCYSVVYLSAPLYASLGLGTISPLLLLGVAAAWRYRDRAAVAGLAVASVITAKLFLWPLWFWLLRTRRYRAAAVAAAASVVGVVASWAAIGFAGFHDYPRLLGRMTELTGINSYSLYALERTLGVPAGAAQAALTLAGVVAVVAALLLVGDDRRMLIAALAISLLATPILWPHYLMLLLVPIALARRSFSRLWLAPICIWADATAWSYGSALRISILLGMVLGVVGLAMEPRSRAVRIEVPMAVAETTI